ncbi:DUF1800 family protein [Roseomonas sp. CCTCC AB2023176]|uniref:DUF1800 domain-containing protein n=1 Tax=Roseomonas sp. CCTCC AB2023176 TaxID=3342640 RepID=UPI0035E0D41D
MDDARAYVAEIRFGLGPRPDGPRPADPRGWLLAQLEGPDADGPMPRGWERFPTAADGLAALSADDADRRAGREANRQGELFRAEGTAEFARLATSAAPFRDRWSLFWANHLTVSRRSGGVTALAGTYMREAIRPHATGRFADLLKAAVRHPAMLIYLDGAASIGPNSPAGRRSRRGLNENLAREVLELHSVSPAAGYTQDDVTSFARLLTGLGLERQNEPLGTVFRPGQHEPGTKVLLGQAFAEGEASVDAALDVLAEHPATHRHLATKIVRHFVADEPPPEPVRRIEAVLRDTKGDLGAAARALVDLPEAWTPPLSKVRAPLDLVVAAYRALGAGVEAGGGMMDLAAGLGQPFWTAPAPIGWPDTAADWVHPEGVMQRFDRLHALAGRFARRDARETLEVVLGPLASDATRTAVLRAGSNRDAITLLLSSPEFQRR